jgi:membrane protease YdiL (CAAX protease family)
VTDGSGSLWRDGAGLVRWGWVVGLFALVAIFSTTLFEGVVWLMGFGVGDYTLTDAKVGFSAWGHLVSGVLATLVAWRLGERPGLQRPALLGPGLLAGALLVTVTVALGATMSGTLGVASCSGALREGVLQLVLVGPTAVGEELWLRGAALRALARGTHPAFAVLGTGFVFGGLHLMNPSATWVAALNVALVGVWFGAMAWRAQSIWPAVGAHLAWNWFEGFVWGQNVSGISPGCSLLTATSAPPFWGGGEFGPEASGLTAALLAVACAVTAFWPKRVRAPGAPAARPP